MSEIDHCTITISGTGGTYTVQNGGQSVEVKVGSYSVTSKKVICRNGREFDPNVSPSSFTVSSGQRVEVEVY